MKKSNDKKLLKIWSRKLKEDAGFKCELCGKSGNECQLHGHHFIGKRHRALKYWLPNGISLCASHHTMGLWSAHENPEWFRTQMLDIRGSKWLKELTVRSNKVFKGTYEQVLDYLDGNTEDYV